ncbi:MAG: hypothetical protein IT523_01590 [Burkholderiales bacterium]|nr:hypothetical protein [Pseudomonadota bacterium]MCC7067126.1 hypothetical protein [Burkholderiales bacterium]MCZ2135432.1 hypothetical protein [Burkholderiales bacterium]
MGNTTPNPAVERASSWARWLPWLAAAVALALVFAAYDQVDLVLQWVTARLC